MASSQLLSRDLFICCVSAVICVLDVDAGTTLDAGLFINSPPVSYLRASPAFQENRRLLSPQPEASESVKWSKRG